MHDGQDVPLKAVVDGETGETDLVEMTADEIAQRDRDTADDATTARAMTAERDADAERARLVAERAADDPAFAALAELTLRGRAL